MSNAETPTFDDIYSEMTLKRERVTSILQLVWDSTKYESLRPVLATLREQMEKAHELGERLYQLHTTPHKAAEGV